MNLNTNLNIIIGNFVCIFGFLIGLLLPTIALSLDINDIWTKEATGGGFFYGRGELKFDAARDSATNEVKGYLEAMPSSTSGDGFGIGLWYDHWGVLVGEIQGKKIVNKYADINQTPDDLSDDVLLEEGSMNIRSLYLIFRPVRFFFIGYGKDEGKLELETRLTTGTSRTREFSYSNDFYYIALMLGLNPGRAGIAPFIGLFQKTPLNVKDFSGSVSAVAVGLYF